MTLDFLEDYDPIPSPHLRQQLHNNIEMNYVTAIRVELTGTPSQ